MKTYTLIDNEISRLEIKLLINQFEAVLAEIDTISELIAGIGKEYYQDDIERLMTIPGFSFLSALAMG